MKIFVSMRRDIWNDYMERIMNKENDWDHNVEGDTRERPVDCVCRDEVAHALNEIKNENASGLSDVSLDLIAAIEEV